MPLAETAATYIGITNENEFYSHHYLSEVFKGDIKDVLTGWARLEEDSEEGIKAPYSQLRALYSEYFAMREKLRRERSAVKRIELQRGFFASILPVLGFDYAPGNLALEDGSEIPVLATVRPGARPPPLVVLGALDVDKEGIDGQIVYEGEDVYGNPDRKNIDQILTHQNLSLANAAINFIRKKRKAEPIIVFEKLERNRWIDRGRFKLVGLQRIFDNKRYVYRFLLSSGEEAGIKSVTFKIIGSNSYGYIKRESGTHRLVRQSPFNADKLRQTSFALVGVLPEFDEMDLPDIVIKDDDLEWQFYRASGQGGQNVQKVSTAVRVKHIPSGIVTTAQTERYQEQNRKIALNLLKAKLWVLEKEKRAKKVQEIKGEYKPASWGTQIRSYVLHPYKMVKDLRTQVETSNTESVLSGNLDDFIQAELVLGD